MAQHRLPGDEVWIYTVLGVKRETCEGANSESIYFPRRWADHYIRFNPLFDSLASQEAAGDFAGKDEINSQEGGKWLTPSLTLHCSALVHCACSSAEPRQEPVEKAEGG